MEILSVKTMSNMVTEVIKTKCGRTYVLMQMFTGDDKGLSYSVFNLNGAEVTDAPYMVEMMNHYFGIKNELESGLYSEDDDADLDPFK